MSLSLESKHRLKINPLSFFVRLNHGYFYDKSSKRLISEQGYPDQFFLLLLVQLALKFLSHSISGNLDSLTAGLRVCHCAHGISKKENIYAPKSKHN